jgi:hypothetical protein
MDFVKELADGCERRLARIAEQRGGRAGGGAEWLPHTNATHARAVGDAAALLTAAFERVNEEEVALLRLAGVWHVEPLKVEGADDVDVLAWLKQRPYYRDTHVLVEWTTVPMEMMCCVGAGAPESLPRDLNGFAAVLADAERAEWAAPEGAWTWLLLVAQRLWPASSTRTQYRDLADFKPKRAEVMRELEAGVAQIGGATYQTSEARKLWGAGRRETAQVLAGLRNRYEAGASFWDVLEAARTEQGRAGK